MSLTRYTTYRETGLEWLETIPSHWEVKRLKQFCSVFPSNVDKKSVEGEAQVRLCNYTDVYYNDFISEDLEFMEATATEEQIKKFTLKAGDTIITKDSETADDIAIAACVTKDLPGVICGYHLSVVRPKEVAYGGFVKRLFDSIYAKSLFAVRANGLTRVGLSQYAIDNVELPLPPVKEQKVIATFLDRETAKIDALIAEQQRLIELLQEKRQAVISHAVTKGLNPNAPMKDSGVEWLGEVPEHWDISRLGHFAAIENGSTPPRNNPEYWEEGTIPWLGSTEVNQGRVATYSEKVTEQALLDCPIRRLPAKTVLIGMIGQGRTRGMAAILELDAAISQNIAAVVPRKRLDPEYLLNFLRASYEWIRSTARGGNQAALNCQIIGELRICLPPLSEQAEISSRISEEMHGLEKLQNKACELIKLLDERRSALISAAVTGQIDVRGLETEDVGQ